MLVDDFLNSEIAISILRSDSANDIELASEIIIDMHGDFLGFGDKTIREFLEGKFLHNDYMEMQVHYNYFCDGKLGWIHDDSEWYQKQGIQIVPLHVFLSQQCDVQQIVDEAAFMSLLEEVV